MVVIPAIAFVEPEDRPNGEAPKSDHHNPHEGVLPELTVSAISERHDDDLLRRGKFQAVGPDLRGDPHDGVGPLVTIDSWDPVAPGSTLDTQQLRPFTLPKTVDLLGYLSSDRFKDGPGALPVKQIR